MINYETAFPCIREKTRPPPSTYNLLMIHFRSTASLTIMIAMYRLTEKQIGTRGRRRTTETETMTDRQAQRKRETEAKRQKQ